MQQPADVDCQLGRLRPWQQHAEVERVQKAPFTDPLALLHQFGVHEGDLAGRPAKVDEPQLEPEHNGVRKFRNSCCFAAHAAYT